MCLKPVPSPSQLLSLVIRAELGTLLQFLVELCGVSQVEERNAWKTAFPTSVSQASEPPAMANFASKNVLSHPVAKTVAHKAADELRRNGANLSSN